MRKRNNQRHLRFTYGLGFIHRATHDQRWSAVPDALSCLRESGWHAVHGGYAAMTSPHQLQIDHAGAVATMAVREGHNALTQTGIGIRPPRILISVRSVPT